MVPGPSNSSQFPSSPVPSKSKRSRRQDMEPSSDPQEEEMVQGLGILLYYGTAMLNSYTGGQMVNCPVCNVSIVMGDINTHLDSGCQKKSFNTSGAAISGAKDEWTKLFLKKGKNRDNG